MTKDEAAMCAAESVAALRDAIQAGWKVPNELKEPAFDTLRGRGRLQETAGKGGGRIRPKSKPKE